MLDSVVLLYGCPGVGKSTVAPGIATRVGLPRLSKDAIKEALWDSMPKPDGLGDLEWSRQLGAAAFEAMWRTAPDLGPRLMIEAPLDPAWVSAKILELSASPIEVFLWARPELVHERHHARIAEQHACHLPHGLPTLEQVQASVAATRPLGLGGPLLEVDLSEPCDIDSISEWVAERIRQGARSQ